MFSGQSSGESNDYGPMGSEFAGKVCGFCYPGFESHYNLYHLPLFKPLLTRSIPKL